MNRRNFLASSTLLADAGLGLGSQFPSTVLADSHVIIAREPLPIPEVIEPGTSAVEKLDAIIGSKQFIQGKDTRTQGFSQPYLGPVIRFKRGLLATWIRKIQPSRSKNNPSLFRYALDNSC